MTERGQQTGQVSLEYLGVVVVVGLIALALVQIGGGFADRIVCEVGARIASVTGSGDRSCGDRGPQRSALQPGAGPGAGEPARPARHANAPRAASARGYASRSASASRVAARTYAARRARLRGVIKGTRIDTSDYRRKDYCDRYKCKEPHKTQYPMPNFQGRRGGKLRINLFIKQRKVRPGGVAPITLDGDDRGFDPNFDSLRTRVTFVFDFKSDKLTVLINPSCSKGTSIVIRDGCSSPKDNKVTVAAGPNGKGDHAPYSIDYSLKNSRTGVPIVGNRAPAIDGRIAIRPFRDKNGRRRLKVTIYNDGYPSIEGYYDPPGSKGPRTVCQSTEGKASDLAGSAGKRCESVA